MAVWTRLAGGRRRAPRPIRCVWRPRVWMIGVKDKIWFLREGLFAKYVISLVGLVVFVLAVNGAMETWISYRATKTTLTDGMAEKAEATAKRIEQSISELERQISWVTRASVGDARAAPRRLRAAAEPGLGGQPALPAQRPGPRAAAAVAHRDFGRQQRGFLPRRPLYRNRRPRRQLRAGLFHQFAALHVDRGGAFRLQRRRHRRRHRPSLPLRLPR